MWIPVRCSMVWMVSRGPPADIAALILLVPCPGMSTNESRGNPRIDARRFPGFSPMMWIESERPGLLSPGSRARPRARGGLSPGLVLARGAIPHDHPGVVGQLQVERRVALDHHGGTILLRRVGGEVRGGGRGDRLAARAGEHPDRERPGPGLHIVER